MIKKLITIGCLLACQAVIAEENDKLNQWIKVASTKSSDLYLNPRYMKVTNNSMQDVELWEKTILTQVKEGDIGEVGEYGMIRMHVRCSTNQLRTINIVYYGKDGSIKESTNKSQYYPQWENVVPESIGEIEVRKVCNYLFNNSGTDNQL